MLAASPVERKEVRWSKTGSMAEVVVVELIMKVPEMDLIGRFCYQILAVVED